MFPCSVRAEVTCEDIDYNMWILSPDFMQGAVSLEDVLEWNHEYQTREPLTISKEEKENVLPGISELDLINDKYYEEFLAISVPFLTSVEYSAEFGRAGKCAVFDEQGQFVFIVERTEGELSGSLEAPYLKGCCSGDYIGLTRSSDEVKAFVEKEYAIREREKQEKLQIMAEDEELAEFWEDAKFIWEKREKLGVVGIEKGNGKTLEIYGVNSETEFAAIIKEIGYTKEYVYEQALWTSQGYDTYELYECIGQTAVFKNISEDIYAVDFVIKSMELE